MASLAGQEMMRCRNCDQPNPNGARFCGGCGRPLSAAPMAGNPGGLQNFGLFMIGLLFVGAAVSLVRVRGGGSLFGEPAEPAITIRQEFPLIARKAEALYQVFSPSDVRVRVGRYGQGLVFTGTPGELEVIQRAIELVTRFDHLLELERQAAMTAARPFWNSSGTYRLDRRKGRALYALLAFEDVPVLVSGKGSKIQVSASPDDQYVLRDLVAVLEGKRRR